MRKNTRFWEIDFIRGIGLLMMLVIHFFYYLWDYTSYNVDMNNMFWTVFIEITGIIFIGIVGISLYLSYQKKKKFVHYLKRGSFIFALGMLITIITFLFVPDEFVRFGVLHFIGISIILAYPLIRFKAWNLLIGTIILLITFPINSINVSCRIFFWLSYGATCFKTVDHFAVFPWIGIVIMGVGIGSLLFPTGKRKIKLPDLNQNAIIKLISFLGRHTLIIYLLHQPMLYLIFYLLGYI